MDLSRIRNRAQDLLKEHGDKIEKGVGKAEQFAKSKTRTEKQHGQIDKVAGKIRSFVDDADKRPSGQATPPATPPTPPPATPPATPPTTPPGTTPTTP